MKKLVFAAIAALVMVSVSNVFANGTQSEIGYTLPADTTENDSISPVDQPTDTPVDQPTDTPVDTTTADSAANTAQLMF